MSNPTDHTGRRRTFGAKEAPSPPDRIVPDDDIEAALAAMIGRVVRDIYVNDDGDGSGAQSVTLTMDDGRRYTLVGWGHDYWGIHLEVGP